MSGSDESGSSGQSPGLISPALSRAARGLLGWSTRQLAAKVGLDEREILGFEEESGELAAGRIEAIRSALMRAGIVFLDGDAPGVRIQASGTDEGTRLDALTTENDR